MKSNTIAIEDIISTIIDSMGNVLQETLRECESRCCDDKKDRTAIVKQFRKNAQKAFDDMLSDFDKLLKYE